VRVLERLREIFWESKRAPSTMTTLSKNPYRREYLIKRMYGRTKEERVMRKKELK
jgi:hypothetical protein